MAFIEITGTWPGTPGGALASWSFPTLRFSQLCIQWAFLSCSPGRLRVPMFLGGQVASNRTVGSVSSLHYQSGTDYGNACTNASVGSPDCLYADNIRIEQDLVNLPPAGGSFRLKLCVTVSDQSGGACICDASCGGNASYVDITSYYAGP